MSWIAGYAETCFHHAEQSLNLTTRGGKDISLSDFCKSVTPPCWLNPLLFNGHLQTFWTVMKNQDPPVYYKRKIFEAEDPAYKGTFAVDFAVTPYDTSDDTLPPRTTYFEGEEIENLGSSDSKPMLVVLHGLSGGSHEVYLRHVLYPLIGEAAGWEACVVNSRGCAKSKITSSVLYNARATWDVRQVVKWLKKAFPNRPLFAIGFSLGANILTNYLGEEGSSCVLKAAVVCSNPWDLHASSLTLQRSWLGLEVYSRTMGNNMKALVNLHAEQISKNPRIDLGKVNSVKYLHEFDRVIQGPTWGYPTEGAYYRDAASTDSLLAIRIPIFMIHAEDDPALPYEEIKQTPYGVMCTTSMGGHLSWFEFGGGRWFTRPITGFFKKMVEDIDLDKSFAAIRTDHDPEAEGDVLRPVFSPMRRKLHMRSENSTIDSHDWTTL